MTGQLGAPFPGIPEAMFRPFLAAGKMRFVGEILAVVLAETREQAVDAAELVFAELESLPAVTDPEEALRDETLLFDEHGYETPTPVNPLGATGIGESGTIGSTPAALNAVIDAVSHLGVRHIDMPANGERVWRAIQDARAR